MASDFPPGVFKGDFTFSPRPNITEDTVRETVRTALATLAAAHTEVEVHAEYVPTRA